MVSDNKVAIIGAGPGGLVTARYLVQHGFKPVLFEQSNRLGGQWNQGAPHSGIWPAMLANTSRVTTQFSDLPLPSGAPMFLHNRDVLGYLKRYADLFGITRRIRLECRVDSVTRHRDGYAVMFTTSDGNSNTEHFPYVIVASGRYRAPKSPSIRGLETFSGSGGISHTFHFRDAAQFRGLRVVIAGCSISAVEIAPELVFAGAARVVSCFRRQRYVLQRIVKGVPIDVLAFQRFGVLAAERLPLEQVKHSFREFILATSGAPETWGARKADDDPFVAGITQGQFYLPLIAERRIVSKPWIRSIDGQQVTFDDDTTEEADAIILGTGFHLDLPFLSPAIAELVGGDGPALRVYRHTFHPLLPNMAFVGLYHQQGPYLPSLELQARWVAYTWAGLCPQAEPASMAHDMAADLPTALPVSMHQRCIAFARDAGVEPDLDQWPELKRALLFGPLSPVSFRLSGPDALPDAPQRFAGEAAEFGLIASPKFTADERIRWDLLAESVPRMTR
jgi:cation diffusion facilitator CzcD-associated flavoprotein CzcO